MTTAQESLFRTTLYSIGDAVIATDRAGRVTHMNPVAERLTGWSEAGARGVLLDKVFNIVSEKTRAAVENPVEKILEKGMIVGLASHTILINKDGAEYPIADSGAPIIDDSGEVTGVVIVFRDMTEELKMQQALETSEMKFRALVEQSVDMLYVHDLDGNILEANRAAVEATGYSREELTAMSVFDLHYDEVDREDIKGRWRSWQAGVDNSVTETWHRSREGILIPVEVNAGKVIAGDEELILALARDVSERREAMMVMEEGREWYRTIAEDIPALVTRLSPDMRFTYANEAYCRLYRQSCEDITGRDLFDFVPAINRELVRGALLALTPEKPIMTHEHTIETYEGELRWIRWTNRALFDGQGRLKEILCVGEDTTEHKEVEAELRESERRSRALLGAVPDMFFRYSGEGVYLDLEVKHEGQLSGAGLRLHREGKLIGSRLAEVLDPGLAEKLMGGVGRALATGELQVIEYSYPVDGSEHSFEARLVSAGDSEVVSIVRDITARKQAEKALEYQFQYEKLVADISAAFVSIPIGDIDEAIDHALELSGRFFGADRSFLFLFYEDGRFMTNTNEWCAEGIASQRERNQGYELDEERWWPGELFKGRHVYVPDIEELPARMEKDKQEFRAEEIRSFLTIPLLKDGKTFGFFGFDGVREEKRWTEEQIVLLKVVAGIISGAIIKHETEEALKDSENRYRDILATIEEAYYETDLAGNIMFFNDAGLRIFGDYSPEEAQGMSFKKLYRNPEAAYEAFNRVFVTGKPEKGLVLEMIRRDGSSFFCEISITLRKNKQGEITGFKGIGKDVSERIEYEKKLEYLGMHDQLTGIYNRAFFETELKRLNGSREYPITIISADLDGLKLINDTMGHDAGDHMLQGCAAVMSYSLREADILARVGGDEFSAILLRTGRESGEKVVRRIREKIEQYNRENEALPLGISVGVATAEKDDLSLKELFKRADDRMYRDKLYSSKSSRNRIVKSLLAALAERDYLTGGHARRLEEHCRAMGEKVGLTSDQMADLALLAQVHDLGKVGIPDSILFKPGPLNEEEWEVMRGHPEKGYRIATSSPDLAGVAELILKHHERWDGKGYPLRLKGEEIPLECRILAIVDAFDAMTHNRPYDRVRSDAEAVKELEDKAGTQFDPELVPIFISILEAKS